MQGLQGKVAVIAGGATGIGAASAERLAAEGAKVVVGDINRERVEETAARIIAAGGEAVAVHFDLTDESSCQNLISMAVSTFGGLDLLHNNGADLSPQTPHCVTRNHSHGEDVGVLSLALSLFFTPDARSHEGASENVPSMHASCRL